MATASVCKPNGKWFSSKRFFKLPPVPLLRPKNKSSPSPSPSPSPPSSKAKTTTTKQDELLEVFRHLDTDGDGKVSSEELGVYFASVGEPMTRDNIKRVIKDFDGNGDELLDFGEFVRLVEGEDVDGVVDDEVLRMAFEMFEAQKGSGCITPRGLQQMFSRLGDNKSFQECLNMIHVFDLDGNGVLDFHEFRQMMT